MVQIDLPPEWQQRLADPPAGELRGEPMEAWRLRARGELGLATDRPIVATGHQTLLWHPGILAKYLLVQALTGDRAEIAAANLIVDQHTDRFGNFDVPVREADGSLGVATITLTTPRPDVPMGRHPAFTPPAVNAPANTAVPSGATGVERIVGAVAAHRDASDAAAQMAAALDDLMSPWVTPIPGVCSTALMNTSPARALLEEMAAAPHRCAACYNAAVAQVPGTGIARLDVTGEHVELPLWRLDGEDRRERADHGDLVRFLEGDGGVVLLPRALFLTLLVRTAMCDLYVHGTGGANYDRAMERWLWSWLAIRPCPIAVATATLLLPFDGDAGNGVPGLAASIQAEHHAWHDPEAAAGVASPGPVKASSLQAIDAAPRRSPQRFAAFRRMHEQLAELREQHAEAVAGARARTAAARQRALDARIFNRRTWPFPLYPPAMIDELAAAVDDRTTRPPRPRQPAPGG